MHRRRQLELLEFNSPLPQCESLAGHSFVPDPARIDRPGRLACFSSTRTA